MKTDGIFERRNDFFLPASTTMRGAIAAGILIGIVTIALGFAQGLGPRIWASLLFNTFFFFTLALGGVAFGGMQDVIGALWARPVKRLHESFGSFIPVGALLLIAFFVCIKLRVLGAGTVYRWIDNPGMLAQFFGKRTWLTENGMLIRDTAALVAIFVLVRWHMRKTLQPDHIMLAGDAAKAREAGESSRQKLRYWSSPILFAYAMLFSMLAFDLTMSLSPTWYSTLWGGWSFAIMMQTLMATLLIAMFALRHTAFGHYFGRQQFHDVGKLMHAFTIFFAYLTYAHVLTYWYGNMPEETEYYIHRLHGPWLYIVLAAPVFSFLIPLFGLLPKMSKWTSALAIPIAVMILIAQWATALLVVIPEVVKGEAWNGPWYELGVFFGVFGLFLASVYRFGLKNPMLSIADPLLPRSLAAFEHH